MKRTVKRDWRGMTVADVCPSCPYFSVCEIRMDCKALEILVKIHEDMDCGNTDY